MANLIFRAALATVIASFSAESAGQSDVTLEAFDLVKSFLEEQGHLPPNLEFEEFRHAGERRGCSVSFKVRLHDWAAFPQGITSATGHVSYFVREHSQFIVTGLMLTDFFVFNGAVESEQGQAIDSLLTRANDSLAEEKTGTGFTQDGSTLLTRYRYPGLRLMEFMKNGPIELSFTRVNGGQYVSFPIDTTDPAVSSDLSACMTALLRDFLEKYGSPTEIFPGPDTGDQPD